MPASWETPTEPNCSVFIGTPNTGLVTYAWAVQLESLKKIPNTTIFGWKGAPFDVARNNLVREARKVKAQYLFFLDSDVHPPADAISNLMACRMPIISGLVLAKRGKGYPAIWRRNGLSYAPITQFPQSAVIPVDAIPMGCCLIDMRVFDVIPEPWFKWEIDLPEEKDTGKLSEDFYFCRKAQANGLSIGCYTGVRCEHETMMAVDPTGESKRQIL